MTTKILALIISAPLLFASLTLHAEPSNLKGNENETHVNGGLGLNPYLPNVSCNFATQKLWYSNADKRWHCVNDRTKTGH